MTVRELVDIIKPQVDLQLGEILKNFNQKGIRPSEFVGGFILTGGGSLLKGMPEAFSKYFQAFSKNVNFTEEDFACSDDNIINSQIYTTTLAVLKNNLKNISMSNNGGIRTHKNNGIVQGIKNLFSRLK